jgi:iron uptake system component EfeO
VPVSSRHTSVLVAAMLALFVAACGGGTATQAPTVGPETTPLPGSSAATGTAPAGTTVAVSAKEYAFTPSTLTVAAGAVRFVVTNAGNEEHEFEIFKGEQVVDEIEGLVPGLTKELPVTLAAGAYTFVCKLSGHDQLGMKGTLTVTDG